MLIVLCFIRFSVWFFVSRFVIGVGCNCLV